MSHPNPTTRTSPDKPGFVRVTNDRGHGGIRTRPISRKDAAAFLRDARRSLRREVFKTLFVEEVSNV